jgi:hypothetical protein
MKTMLLMATTLGVLAGECIAADSPVTNSKHAEILAGVVASAGYPACQLTFATQKGRYKGAVYFVVGCKDPTKHYLISVEDPSAETTVLDCDLAQLFDADCFAPWE